MIHSHRRISETQASQIVLGDDTGPKYLHEYEGEKNTRKGVELS